ncbi:MAG: hypothetical protein MZW92_00885 [Comamonadaceae bacterium]|nr:hypothetical protein [Comamonadaceae bacterium]
MTVAKASGSGKLTAPSRQSRAAGAAFDHTVEGATTSAFRVASSKAEDAVLAEIDTGTATDALVGINGRIPGDLLTRDAAPLVHGCLHDVGSVRLVTDVALLTWSINAERSCSGCCTSFQTSGSLAENRPCSRSSHNDQFVGVQIVIEYEVGILRLVEVAQAATAS